MSKMHYFLRNFQKSLSARGRFWRSNGDLIFDFVYLKLCDFAKLRFSN